MHSFSMMVNMFTISVTVVGTTGWVSLSAQEEGFSIWGMFGDDL